MIDDKDGLQVGYQWAVGVTDGIMPIFREADFSPLDIPPLTDEDCDE